MATPTPLNPHPRPDDLFSSRERWYQTEAPDHVLDGVWENLDQDQARRIVIAIQRAERYGQQASADREIGKIMRDVISPYLDAACDREVNDE